MSYYGPPSLYGAVTETRTQFTILYETESLVIVPFHELAYSKFQHSTVCEDLDLTKMWADNIEKLGQNHFDVYLWDKTPPASGYFGHLTVSTATNTSLMPYTYTLNTTATNTVYSGTLNTYYNKVNSGTASGTGWIGSHKIAMTYDNAADNSYHVNNLLYTHNYFYVIVKKSDIKPLTCAVWHVAGDGITDDTRTISDAIAAVEEPKLFDGLTKEACLEKFIQMQRNDTGGSLTKKQLDVARIEWSAELKRLADVSKTKDKNQILVEIDADD